MYEIKECYRKFPVGSPEAVQVYKELLEAKRLQKAEYDGEEMLLAAARAADAPALKFLFEQGLDSSYKKSYGATLMHVVAEATNSSEYSFKARPEDVKAAVQLLMEHKVSPMRKDDDGRAPIHVAARFANAGFIEAICESGRGIGVTQKDGLNALHILAEWSGRDESGLKYAYGNVEKARKSAEENDHRIYKEQYESSQKRLQKELDGIEDYFKCAKLLIAAGLDPYEKDNYGNTPLDKGIHYGAKKINALIAGQIPMDENEYDENTPHYIAAGGMTIHKAVAKTENNETDYPAVKALIALGADVNEEDGDEKYKFYGLTPLAIAILLFDVTAAELLVAAGADVNYVNTAGFAPIAYLLKNDITRAAQKENRVAAIIKLLTESGFDINRTINEKAQPFLTMADEKARNSSSALAMVEAVLLFNAEADLAGADGRTPLSFLAESRRGSDVENVFISLLDEGADVNAADNNGNTVLMYVAQNSDFACSKNLAELLFNYGRPNMNAVNNEGKTALEIAADKNNEPLINFLMKKM